MGSLHGKLSKKQVKGHLPLNTAAAARDCRVEANDICPQLGCQHAGEKKKGVLPEPTLLAGTDGLM